MRRVREGARVVVRDAGGRFLLMHFSYDEGPLAGTDYWGLPGGGVEAGETAADAAVRELREETGIAVADPGPMLAEGSYDFRLYSGEEVVQHDSYFLVPVDAPAIAGAGFTPEETRFMTEYRWWTLPELRETRETVIPGNMADILGRMGVE